jgi:hypothetical protein
VQATLAQQAKRERRRVQEGKAKQRERMRLQMDVPNDTGAFITEDDLFRLRTLRTRQVWPRSPPHARCGKCIHAASVRVVVCADGEATSPCSIGSVRTRM